METTNYYNDDSKLIIPSLFYDSISNMPIERCQVCQKKIIETDAEYMIEKVFRRNPISGKMEVMFEFAICFSCALTFVNSYSAQSKENLQRYFAEHLEGRITHIFQKSITSEIDIYDHLSTCAITGKKVTELEEYQIIGRFRGGFLKLDEPPFLIGANSMDDVADLLSNETIDNMDDFTGKYLTGPPEFRDFFKSPRRRPVLI
ncbi:MAG: hypothetical protein WBH71_06475 [Bacteroidales bacterium]|jgi:hypothetical protein|nr:hypothetical protein [Bacteroidales bacterium]MDI9592395.1 hypothetical protein [Bacteroidota bacterium]NLH33162.1 hypothetical protein [Lentimicrobium sp.]OQC37124.1 MAG: hypothetical protein BWX63_01373 [Bacteroidetes bacterium ADurb.Bin041]MBP7874397.1 hypothetical protein [Bacteroidales bacterium]